MIFTLFVLYALLAAQNKYKIIQFTNYSIMRKKYNKTELDIELTLKLAALSGVAVNEIIT